MGSEGHLVTHLPDCPGGKCLCTLVKIADERKLERLFYVTGGLYWLMDWDGPYAPSGKRAEA